MLKLDELFSYLQASGKTMDYDRAYGGECVDVVKYLLDLCYWAKPWRIGNANELWDDKYWILKKLWFIKIVGTKDMQKGDIIFLKTGISFQHVGIFIEERSNNVLIFDQVGNGDKVWGELSPSYREWSKSIVMGVWRHKDAIDPVQKWINTFCEKYWIRKRGNDEQFSCREILSILARMEK